MPTAKTRKARQPPPPLTHERIETTALRLIEEEGLDALSMRKLGQALGCEAMSLYHHYPSKAHVLDAILDRLVGGMVFPPRALAWKERLRRIAYEFRDTGRRHPEFSRFMLVHQMDTPTGLRFLEQVLEVFSDGGFTQEQAARAFRVFGYYLAGAVMDETAGYAHGPSAAQPVGEKEFVALAPTVAAAGRYFEPEQMDKTFALGLDLLMDGLERMLHARKR